MPRPRQVNPASSIGAIASKPRQIVRFTRDRKCYSRSVNPLSAPLGLPCALAGALFFSGLATIGARGQEKPPEPAAAYRIPTDPGELLKTDEPMRRFFGERIQPRHQRADQLRELLDAIFRPDGLNFTYDFHCTLDAREAFRQRRGNCVSFAFLVVAIAREFGFEASFQNVALPDRWDRIGTLIISVQHMNVRVKAGGETYLVDPRMDVVAGIDRAAMKVVDDRRAFAQFYNTRGVFELLHGRPAEALRCMMLATSVDPDCAGAWANRASIHSHLGDLTAARSCFERSLQADPKDLFALEGYVSLLQRLGSKEDLRISARFERRAQAVRDRNPYHQQHLAGRAQERGDWTAAEKLLRRAIALKDNEPEFHEQLVKVLLQLGREDAARRAAAKLDKLRRQLAESAAHFTP